MAEVKWIKIVVDIFDDEKMKLIDSMPEADAIEIIWFKLLTLAGKCCFNGVYIFNDKMAFTDEMFASIFNRPLNTVRLALKTFEDLGMIEIIDNVYTIPNWEKYQTLDAYERKKARDREYQAKRREAKKQAITDKSSENRLTVERDCSYSYSLSNNNYIDSNNTNNTDSNNTNNNTDIEKPDLEIWYDAFLELYPNKKNSKCAKTEYLNYFKGEPIEKWRSIGQQLHSALKLYLEDYKASHDVDKEGYKFLENIEGWLRDSAYGWIVKANKIKEKEEQENVTI